MKIKNEDINPSTFSREVLNNLVKYGFGTLSKSDLKALLYFELIQSYPDLKKANDFEKAEILRIADSILLSIRKRSGIWLEENQKTDQEIFQSFLVNCINSCIKLPNEKEIRIVIDDEMEKCAIQKSLEQIKNQNFSGIYVDISTNDRLLIIKQADLISALTIIAPELYDRQLNLLLQDKKYAEFKEAVKKSSGQVIKSFVDVISQSFCSYLFTTI